MTKNKLIDSILKLSRVSKKDAEKHLDTLYDKSEGYLDKLNKVLKILK